jgi:hypothetical protein
MRRLLSGAQPHMHMRAAFDRCRDSDRQRTFAHADRGRSSRSARSCSNATDTMCIEKGQGEGRRLALWLVRVGDDQSRPTAPCPPGEVAVYSKWQSTRADQRRCKYLGRTRVRHRLPNERSSKGVRAYCVAVGSQRSTVHRSAFRPSPRADQRRCKNLAHQGLGHRRSNEGARKGVSADRVAVGSQCSTAHRGLFHPCVLPESRWQSNRSGRGQRTHPARCDVAFPPLY